MEGEGGLGADMNIVRVSKCLISATPNKSTLLRGSVHDEFE